MDCIRIAIILLLLSASARAQTFSEWFRQKKTQKRYLLEQIAALEAYNGCLKAGYYIVKGRLESISSAVSREYGLHNSHYQSLKTVNVVIKNDPRVNGILRRQQDVLRQTAAIKKQSGLSNTEKDYTAKVCAALLKDCDARMNDLQTILTDSQTEMSDEERIRQIARLHIAMQDNYRFVTGFSNQLKLYVSQKQQEQNDNITLTKLYAGH